MEGAPRTESWKRLPLVSHALIEEKLPELKCSIFSLLKHPYTLKALLRTFYREILKADYVLNDSKAKYCYRYRVGYIAT